jgi:hypothetical protein
MLLWGVQSEKAFNSHLELPYPTVFSIVRYIRNAWAIIHLAPWQD